ncbi:MAG: glycosyltransferase [Candidatus Baltobacteraceae bacterium]
MKVSFVIATLNEIARLPRVIESIRNQRYPSDLVEIVVVDGLSDDGTQAYARSAGCVVVDNPRRLAEPGHLLGYAAATGDLLVIIAADNVLHTPEFVARIVEPFADPNVYAAIPRVVSTIEDNLATRYINDFTDPFNHFLYASAATPLTFARAYRVKRATPTYVVYDFPVEKPPLVAIAQGVTVRAGAPRRAGWEEDDILPIVDILRAGHEVAYVPHAEIEHHTVAGLRNFVQKFGPRIAKRLEDREQPVWERADSWTPARRLRAYLWPFYSISIVAPALVAIAGAIRDRRATWFYHPIINFALGVEFWRRALPYAWSVAGRRLRGQRAR